MRVYFLLATLTVTAHAQAGIYKCIDENGKTVYQTSQCPDENKASTFNVTAGSHTHLADEQKKSAIEKQKVQQEEEEKKLAAQKRQEEQEKIKHNAHLESMRNQQHIRDNPNKYSPYAIPPYSPGKRPPVVEAFKHRLPDIERYRREAAEIALAQGDCGRVEGAELNVKSQQENLNFFIECSSGKKVYLSEQQINDR